jgi:phosphopantetheinyl transferase
MPLLKQWKIGAHATAAIWKIEEQEAFFAERTGLVATHKAEKRRTEHLAARYLLTQLEEDFPIHAIAKDEHDKPRVPRNEYYFSISHSWPYVTVVIDPYQEVGIDIQTWHPRIAAIQHKYLSAEEQEVFNTPELMTLAWCGKEAVYKWAGRRGVDFIQHLPLENFNNLGEKSNMTIYYKLSKMPQMVLLENFISADFACSYVSQAQDWAIY